LLGIEHRLPQLACLRVGHDRGLDIAGLVLKIPVTTQAGVTGRIIRGRDIGIRQLGQRVYQDLTGLARSEVTAIDQDVAFRSQRCAPGGDEVFLVLQRNRIKGVTAELDIAVTTVTDQMDRIEIGVLEQQAGDLINATSLRVDHYDVQFTIVPNSPVYLGEQGLVIGDTGIDDDQFLTN